MDFQKRILLTALALLFFISSSVAQLKADFTVDKTGGCSPLTVSFTNTTTGASAGATYRWQFGNNNSSTLKNPAATFTIEQTYTITLIVTDGNNSSTQTKQVTVYKKPTADFSFDVVKGCLPLPVNFTANATAGDGTIANYYWDFGDGATQQTQSPQIQHTYNFAQYATAGLTVTNNYGCYTSVEKPATHVLGAIQAAFSADKTFLCRITDAVQFTNTSSGPGTLSYAWDFGDGTTSTTVSPSHIYNKKGIYTITLTVSNTDGCSNTSVQANFINVADYKADFDVPQLICEQSQVSFTDKSTPTPTSQVWWIDNSYQCGYCYSVFYYTFNDTFPHKVRLINTYGTCTDTATKDVSVKIIPYIKPFIVNIPLNCGAPVTIGFKDTTQDITRWLWNFDWSVTQPSSTIQAPSYTYTGSFGHVAELTVTNAAGCSASEFQNVYTGPVNVSIGTINTNTVDGCDSVVVNFIAYATDSIISYQWNFGDGFTSSDMQPKHTFKQEGTFVILLNYVTKKGCKGTANYSSVYVSKKHTADFTVSPGTTICGNTPVNFQLTGGAGTYNQWSFGDGNGDFYEFNNYVTHQYARDSVYTISVILSYDEFGLCRDTITKKDYIKVLPPFPKILTAQNTCDGLRNVVTFKDTSYKALTWDWNFGDGSTDITSNFSQTLTHTYAKTGAYKVVLTNTNGQCSVRDSTIVYVLLKQKPLLSANATSVCSSGSSTIYVSNMETNPAPSPYFGYGNYYGLFAMQYGDSTSFAYNGYPFQNSVWQNSTNFSITGLDPAKKDLRIISTSAYFGCNDTTNFIPLKITGPKAGFKIIESSPCYEHPVILQDTSIAGTGQPIKTWQWNFGDNGYASETRGGIESHIYNYPGQYQVQLTVTDVNGCTNTTASYTNFVNPSGPKSAFTYNPVNVTPNTPVSFYNNTNTFNSGNTQYKWLFGDGSSSTDYYPSHTYTSTGIDTVRLIASNPDTHCIDTSLQIINVKIINTAFSFTTSFITGADCPPAIVRFTNTSANANTVSWDFGDGSTTNNQNYPSHTYYKPGTYKITLYGYGYNNTVDTTIDSITVKAPAAKIKANPYFGCTSQLVTLSALTTEKVNSFNWDFGDGTVVQSKDTFATHQFLTAGVYEPSLIVSDSNGCSAVNDSAIRVVVDSLFIAIKGLPNHICDSAKIFFTPQVVSVAADQAQQTLVYHWNFGTGNVADTSNIKNAIFTYKNPGTYTITFSVVSPYGCAKQTSQTITVYKSSIASINAPSAICQNGSAQFNGSASLTDNIQWQWIFNNGNNSTAQNPSPQIFNTAGDYKILLIVNHSGCFDTAVTNLTVHPTPVINATPKQAVVCLGKTIQLNANDGINYLWSPANTLNNNTIASPVATPVINTTYIVQSTTSFGCSGMDSSVITVAQPFKVKIPADTFVCKGSSIILPASGANTYNWISGDGLNNTQIANPVATPQLPTAFTVVGYDAYNCFTDTETVHINIEQLPTVNAGQDVETISGTEVQLGATGSADVTEWNWSPVDYLSCTDCESPISTPKNSVTYIVTGKNKYGCAASDTVVIKLVCSEDHVFVPSAFSPNNDGNNDVFYIKGKGIKIIKSLRIFSRWGQMVFEKTNINIDDRTAGWNGNFKGSPVATGAYVYIAELECDTGEPFVLKGTLVITR